jgi:hypothetical protein
MEKTTLKCVLIGEDKRATGNALLNKRIFKTAPFGHSTESDMTDFQGYNLFYSQYPRIRRYCSGEGGSDEQHRYGTETL